MQLPYGAAGACSCRVWRCGGVQLPYGAAGACGYPTLTHPHAPQDPTLTHAPTGPHPHAPRDPTLTPHGTQPSRPTATRDTPWDPALTSMGPHPHAPQVAGMEDESDIDAELAAQHAESEAAQAALDAELATLNAELAQREAALVVAYTQRSKAALKNGTAAELLADSEVALAYHVPKLHHKLLQQVSLQDLNLTPHRIPPSRPTGAHAVTPHGTPRLLPTGPHPHAPRAPTLTAHTELYPHAPRYPTLTTHVPHAPAGGRDGQAGR